MQLTTALTRAGADVVQGPTLSGDVPAPDEDILADTAKILAGKPAWVVATSGVGMKLWLEAADRGGLGEELRTLIQSSRGVARGSKPIAGFVAAGAKPTWVSEQGTDRDVASWLSEHVAPGEAIAVQLHGGRTHAYAALAETGLELLTVLPYASTPVADPGPAHALIGRIVEGTIDVVTFTSPAAARNLFALARALGPDVHTHLVARLQSSVAVASIGPVTSEALEEEGVDITITPRRFRTGDLVRAIQRWKDDRDPAAPAVASRIQLHPTDRTVHVDGAVIPLGPREYDIFATLVRSRGDVFRPEEFAVLAWGHEAPKDPTTVRNEVARLRKKFADTDVTIETVRGVGYRLGEAGRPAPSATDD